MLRSSTQTGKPVVVHTSGGNDESIRKGLGVGTADFKAALETSLVDTGLFSHLGEGGYQLDARILNMRNPGESAVFEVITEIEVAYTLRSAGAVVWEKTIRSSHRTESDEALLGEFRDRISAEGATRENIKIAISSMSERLK
ncbi:hypothetical protein ACFQY0_11655 [Haloferula chungangensis]|uniref:Uncharacterized protein n=1 Tax=Haloferula chungangensis TaxID=1048331 RepID=A0ABW2L8H7_9BACT